MRSNSSKSMFGTTVHTAALGDQFLFNRNGCNRSKPELENNWHLLGKGAYAEVYLNPISMDAVKVVQKSNKKAVANIERECKVLKSISHAFIVKFKNFFDSDSSLYLSIEYALGGDLRSVLKDLGSLPERVVKHYSAELASAIAHLHQKGFVHRDIKPENVLIDIEGHIKLCDFGLCRHGADGLNGLITLCGTPPYIAPEVYNCSSFTGGYGSAIDWWAFGILLYETVVGSFPWNGRSFNELYSDEKLSFPKYLSKHITSLINSLLIPNPSQRIGTWNPREVLCHNFFSGIDWQALEKKEISSPFNPHIARAVANTPKMEEPSSSSTSAPAGRPFVRPERCRHNIFGGTCRKDSSLSSFESNISYSS